jgi:hypothetical protein
MANTKVYEMPGCISCRLIFTLGHAQPFEAFFDGGVPDKGFPAVYTAKSIGQQLAIEHSQMFKVGKIRVAQLRRTPIRVTSKFVSDATPVVEEPVIEETPKAAKDYAEVTDLIGAIAILKGEYGVSATRLKTEASVLRVAAEYNVSFPNLKA